MSVIKPDQDIYPIPVGPEYYADVPLNPMPLAASVMDTITPETDRSFILRLAIEYYKRNRINDAKMLFNMCQHQQGKTASEQAYKLVELAIQLVELQSRPDLSASDRQKILGTLSTEIQAAALLDPESSNIQFIQCVLDLEKGEPKTALKRLRTVTDHHPIHLSGLVMRATIHMRLCEWKLALKCWQSALQMVSGNRHISLEMHCQVRIGIGYCFAQLELFNLAMVSFKRVIDMDSDNVQALCYYASICINVVRRPDTSMSQRAPLWSEGTMIIREAHRAMQKAKIVDAAVCGRLSDVLFLLQVDPSKCSKLIETGLLHAHEPSLKSELQFYRGRLLHKSGDFDGAFSEYLKAVKGDPNLLPAKYALAQMYVQQSELSSALPLLESVREKVRNKVAVAAKVQDASKGPGTDIGDDYDSLKLLAIIHATLAETPIPPSTSMSTKDYTQARERAREMYQRALELFKLLYAFKSREPDECGARDMVALVMHARMLETSPQSTVDSRTGAMELYERAKAVFITTNPGKTVPPELTNNIGVLLHIQGKFVEAQQAYARAFTDAKNLPLAVRNAMLIPLQYNNGRANEEGGNIEEAVKQYRSVVKKNPKYVDAHLRLALIDQEQGNFDSAAQRVADAILNVSTSIESRLVLANLSRTQNITRAARKLYSEILRDHDKFDLVSLLQLGNIYVFDSRSGPQSKEAKAERVKQLTEAYKLYEKAIALDNRNPYAANGLAIALHECGFVEDALRIFEQCREADDSVPCFSLNYAHALAEVGEYRRAIALFEKAQDRYFNNLNTDLMVATAYSYLQLGKTTKSAEPIRASLRLLQQAARLTPSDILIWLNILIVLQDHTLTMSQERAERVALEDMQHAMSLASFTLRQLQHLQTTPFHNDTLEFDRNIMTQRATFTKQESERLEGKIAQMIRALEERTEQIILMRERAEQHRLEQQAKVAELNDEERLKHEAQMREWAEQRERLANEMESFEQVRLREYARRADAAASRTRKRSQQDDQEFIVPDLDSAGEDELANDDPDQLDAAEQYKRRKLNEQGQIDEDPTESTSHSEQQPKQRRLKRKGQTSQPRSAQFISNSDDELSSVSSSIDAPMDVES